MAIFYSERDFWTTDPPLIPRSFWMIPYTDTLKKKHPCIHGYYKGDFKYLYIQLKTFWSIHMIIWVKETLTVFKWVIEQKIKLDFNAFFVQSPRRKGVSGNHLMVESCCTKTWSIHAQLGYFKFAYLVGLVLRHFHWWVIFKFLLRISNINQT